MLVEQALFTSAQTQHARGYHLVARSSGITEKLAQSLAVWGPTHDSLLNESIEFASLNYFVADEDWSVLSRTVYGQSEYSGRGGFRVETNFVVLRREQLAGYQSNPLALARMLLALGHLRLRANSPSTLPPIELPQSTFANAPAVSDSIPPIPDVTEAVLTKLRDHRVAVIGVTYPMSLLAEVLCRLPERTRASLSFTTGLKPSLHRRFHLLFLRTAERRSRQELEASGMVCIDAPTQSAVLD